MVWLHYFFLLAIFFGSASASVLPPVYIDCSTDTPGPPATISGQTGDTLAVHASGVCSNYRQSPGYSNVSASNPAYGSTLNNQIATITLTNPGTGLVYVYNTSPATRGKSFFLQVTGAPIPSTASISGAVYGDVDSPLIIYFIENNGISDLSTSTGRSFSKTDITFGSNVTVSVLSWNYDCDAASVNNIQNNVSESIFCRYYLPPTIESRFISFKGGSSRLQARTTEATTIDPIFPDYPITYTANCTSSDGGLPTSGSASSIDWNAGVNVPVELTPGKTYTCTGAASAAGITTQSYTLGPQVAPSDIPTLSEWVRIILALMVIMVIFYFHNIRQNSYDR